MEDATAAAIHGIGIARTLAKLARAALERGQLKELLPRWSMPDQAVCLIYPHGRHLSAKVRVFVESLARAFATD